MTKPNFVTIQGQELELEKMKYCEKYYGSVESDDAEALAVVVEEIEAQGFEVNLTEGTEKKYKAEFTR